MSDLDQEFQDRIKEEKRIAFFKTCSHCGKSEEEVKLWACARCVESGCIPGYYCSRECQKMAWKSHHKTDCGLPVPKLPNQPSGRPQHKVSEDMKCRLIEIHLVLSWASQMILMKYPDLSKTNTCIHFCFDSISTPSDQWELQYVGVSQIDWTTEQPFKRIGETMGRQAMYSAIFGDINFWNRHIYDEPISDCYHSTSYLPQWPWVVAQICAMRNTSQFIAKQRLCLLLTATWEAAPLSPFEKWRDRYQAPPILEEMLVWGRDDSECDEWERKMAPSICF